MVLIFPKLMFPHKTFQYNSSNMMYICEKKILGLYPQTPGY